MIWLVVFLFCERQFYDDSVPCLQLKSNCTETPGDFKDDELDPPQEEYEILEEPESIFPWEENQLA